MNRVDLKKQTQKEFEIVYSTVLAFRCISKGLMKMWKQL